MYAKKVKEKKWWARHVKELLISIHMLITWQLQRAHAHEMRSGVASVHQCSAPVYPHHTHGKHSTGAAVASEYVGVGEQ